MNELAPTPPSVRWMVWTDREAQAQDLSRHSFGWFWSASGPRGHENGCEGTANAAVHRAQAASVLLMGERELNPPRAAA